MNLALGRKPPEKSQFIPPSMPEYSASQKDHPLISVCIANYNGEAILADCIESVLAQAEAASIEIIIHDDASTDASVDLIRRNYPQVQLIASDKNVGFCVANNRMVAAGSGEFILLLNNDAALFPDALATLAAAAKRPGTDGILTLPQYDWESGRLVDRGCLLDPFLNAVPNLSRDGADELFCGYERYRARHILRWYRLLPRSMRSILARALERTREPQDHHSSSLLKRIHLFVRAEQSEKSAGEYVAPTLFSPDQIAQLRPDLLGKGHSPPEASRTSAPDELQQMMHQDLITYLPQDILAKVDRASIASSLEVRSPFLNRDLVEFALGLPSHWLGNARGGKIILRHAFSDVLSRSTLMRRKQGFAVPVGEWFKGPLADELRSRLPDHDAGLSKRYVLNMLAEHASGTRDHGLKLWAIRSYLTSLHKATSLPRSTASD